MALQPCPTPIPLTSQSQGARSSSRFCLHTTFVPKMCPDPLREETERKRVSRFPQRALKRELVFCFFGEKGQRIFWSWMWSGMVGGEGKTGCKQVFPWVLTKILSAFSIRWKLQLKGIPRLGLELFVGSLVSSWFFLKASKFSTFSLLTRAIFWGCI